MGERVFRGCERRPLVSFLGSLYGYIAGTARRSEPHDVTTACIFIILEIPTFTHVDG